MSSLTCWKPPFVFHPTTPLSCLHGSLRTHEVHQPREWLWKSFCFSWPHCQRLTASPVSRRSRLPVNIQNMKFLAARLHERSRWRRWGAGTKLSWIFLNRPFRFIFALTCLCLMGIYLFMEESYFFATVCNTESQEQLCFSNSQRQKKIIVSLFDFKSLPPSKRGTTRSDTAEEAMCQDLPCSLETQIHLICLCFFYCYLQNYFFFLYGIKLKHQCLPNVWLQVCDRRESVWAAACL